MAAKRSMRKKIVKMGGMKKTMRRSAPKEMECKMCGGPISGGKCVACGKAQGMCEC